MPTILIISKHRYFRDEVRSASGKTGYRMIAREDIIEGLRELKWSCPNLIIWDIEPTNAMDQKGLVVLRAQYAHIQLLLALNRNELTNELKLMSDDVFYRGQPIEKLTTKVFKLLGEPEPSKTREIVPICSFCKKIRTEDGRWVPNNTLTGHSLQFSHGVCPTCERKHYEEFLQPALPGENLVTGAMHTQPGDI